MQTPTLPIQVSGASANANPARANANANADAGQFSQALSREIEQRQANKPAPSQAAAKPAEVVKAPAKEDGAPPASTASTAPAPSQAPAADSKDGAPTPKTAAVDDAADAVAATPVADLIALVASFNLPLQVAVAATKAAPAADPLAASASVAAADPLAAAAVAPAADAAATDATASTDATAFQNQLAQASAGLKLDPQAAADIADAAAKAGAVALPAVAKAAAQDAAAELKAAMPVAAPAAEAAAPAADTVQAVVAAPLAAEAKTVVKSDAPVVRNAGTESLAVQPGEGKKPAATEAVAAVKPQAEIAQPASLRPRESAAEPLAIKEAPVVAQVQQASLQAVQAPAAGSDRIGARVGTPAWDNQVGQKIVWMVAGKEQSASLTLNPPDMGPMQVVLSVNNDQATVTFSSAQPEVRQALENAMPRLREMMGESGISLGNATVNAGMPDQRQAQGGGEQPRGSGAATGRFGNNGSAAEAAARNEARPASRAGVRGAVDTFA